MKEHITDPISEYSQSLSKERPGLQREHCHCRGKCSLPKCEPLSSVLNIRVNEQTKPGLGGRDNGGGSSLELRAGKVR